MARVIDLPMSVDNSDLIDLRNRLQNSADMAVKMVHDAAERHDWRAVKALTDLIEKIERATGQANYLCNIS